MGQTLEPGQPLSAPDYDPETDPVLAQLRRHRSTRGGGRALAAAAAVALLAVGGWFALRAYLSPSREAAREQLETQPTAPPPVSPLQRAEEWCVENLSGTEFAGLPVVEGQGGAYFVLYSARAGDSIPVVVRRYGAGFASGARGEVLELARRRHVERYGGRGLWVGDEIRLLVPIEPGG